MDARAWDQVCRHQGKARGSTESDERRTRAAGRRRKSSGSVARGVCRRRIRTRSRRRGCHGVGRDRCHGIGRAWCVWRILHGVVRGQRHWKDHGRNRIEREHEQGRRFQVFVFYRCRLNVEVGRRFLRTWIQHAGELARSIPFASFGAYESICNAVQARSANEGDACTTDPSRTRLTQTNRDEPDGHLPCGVVRGAASTSPAASHGVQHARAVAVPSTCVPRAAAPLWFHVHVEERFDDLRTETKAGRIEQTRTVRTESHARPSPRRTTQLRVRTRRSGRKKGRVLVGRIDRCAAGREEKSPGSARQGSTT